MPGQIQGDGRKFLDRFKSHCGVANIITIIKSINEVHVHQLQPKSAAKEDCHKPTGGKHDERESRLRGWHSSRRKKTATYPDCRLITMRILYCTSQPPIKLWTAATNKKYGTVYFHSCANNETADHYSQSRCANKKKKESTGHYSHSRAANRRILLKRWRCILWFKLLFWLHF